MKMSFFFLGAEGKVPWAFKMCGIFQACCDAGLGLQWWVFGEGEPGWKQEVEKDVRLA
jgi:hypothetical protein